jgi:predicted TPR repeat methyltransferase
MAADLYSDGCGLYDAKRWDEARVCFERSLALDPSHAKCWNNLGAVNQRLGRSDEALAAYRAALERDPQLFEPYLNLARLSEARGELTAAARYLCAGLERYPGHPMLVHLLAAATGSNTACAPRDHVVAYFDGFAADFDDYLVNTLNYQMPAMFAVLLRPVLHAPARVLDLGCGTGLLGAALASPGLSIIGVDLSSRMLEVAAARRIYAGLVHGDAVEVLGTAEAGTYRAVLAADVFVYIGDLAALFGGVARALEPDGLFAFSIEALAEGSGYRLQPSGRYAHSLDYVRGLASGAGLKEIVTQPVVIRRSETGGSAGHVLVLERL